MSVGRGQVQIIAVGDVQPNRAQPETLFEKVLPVLEWGDLRQCQLECTISDKGTLRSDVRNPAHRVPPANIKALTSAGFNVVSYAGNNNLDYGIEAFSDTLERLSANGIRYFGAGRNLDEARRHLITDVNGVRIAWLSFCSILRDGFEATVRRPGISPLKVRTFYEPLENIYEQPGTPSRTVTVPDPGYLDAAMRQIRVARDEADVVIGCFHWGIHFTHDLAVYQAEVGYAAIENGCDLVLGSHPHCLQAVDVHDGKYIFYSLGNFAFEQPEAIARQGVAEYLSFYGIAPEPDLKVHPHPRHCRDTMVLKILINDKKIDKISFVPVHFSDTAQPEVQEPGSPIHERIMGLMETLCAEIGTRVVRGDGEATVLPEKVDQIDTRLLLGQRKTSYPWLRTLAAN
jgi:hypothetical protein